jgi:membrane-bound metal-dependent hydrolase YbcI (DUF457 family)
MPTPVAHTIAGSCIAVLASRRLPAARVLPVVAAVLFAANLPDLDYLAVLGGREAMERLHQGAVHSIGFVAAAALPLAWALRRRLGFRRAWLLLAGAGLTHLLLDLAVVDRKPPIGFPFFWPFSAERFHSPITMFPGIDRVSILGMRNLKELLVELAWCIPSLLVALWLGRSSIRFEEKSAASEELR